MNADAIFERVWRTYAEARYYRDRGRVEGASEDQSHGEFQTVFGLSRGIRFWFRHIRNSDGATILERSFRIRDNLVVEVEGEEPSTLSAVPLLITRLTGLTLGTAQTVPRLLLGEAIPGRLLGAPSCTRVVSTEPVEGHECFRIAEDPSGRSGEVVFVSTSDFTLRRIVSELNFNSPRLREAARAKGIDLNKLPPMTQVTTYEPQLRDDEPEGTDLEW
jgi:hypothetical protein